MTPELSIRIFVETAEECEAEEDWAALAAIVSKRAHIEKRVVQPYWKIASNYELFCVATVLDASRAEEIYEEVLRDLGAGWRPDEDNTFTRWTFWNPSGAGTFVLKRGRWAHVELIRQR